ncbi:glycosyltransferase 8 domain-containing protein 1-like [Anneissia japonica]|uniref:glycosyltransferase 8 domain-containing protein 1-like n=1 Tax=Anneissia japonica TaxID=1529436 RepID=UPI001425AC88|nr:glycosyltransferase 8 domain-containing protein 1-like [Anneissia japonica]
MARLYPVTLIALVTVIVMGYVMVYYSSEPIHSDLDINSEELKKIPDGFRIKHAVKLADKSVIPVNVLLCSDHRTIGGMITTVNSIRMNAKVPVKYYLVVDKSSINHLQKWISDSVLKEIDYTIIAFNDTSMREKMHPKDGRSDLQDTSPLNYARFYFPDIIPEVKGRIIFVDSDTVVQGNIGELNNTKIAPGNAVALSDDCTATSSRYGFYKTNYGSYINFQHPQVKAMTMNPLECSFNAGVFVADIDEWKKQGITARIDFWIKLNAHENVFGNQRAGGATAPPMMIVFYKKYSKIDPMWHIRHLGLTSGTRYSQTFINAAKLIHWSGNFKPWGRISQHTQAWEKYFVIDPTGQFRLVRRYNLIE